MCHNSPSFHLTTFRNYIQRNVWLNYVDLLMLKKLGGYYVLEHRYAASAFRGITPPQAIFQ
jgi:hypothetical protein